MRFAKLANVNDAVGDMEQLYGTFDLGLDGTPNGLWQARNLKNWKPPEMFQCAFFPGVYIARIRVNRRLLGPLGRVYEEMCVRWTREARTAYGLNQYVKCYAFGDGDGPNLFWWGAAWRLSGQVGGEVLSQAIEIFRRHGFTYVGVIDKRRLRDFELW
jgi:hypothetical protein